MIPEEAPAGGTKVASGTTTCIGEPTALPMVSRLAPRSAETPPWATQAAAVPVGVVAIPARPRAESPSSNWPASSAPSPLRASASIGT